MSEKQLHIKILVVADFVVRTLTDVHKQVVADKQVAELYFVDTQGG